MVNLILVDLAFYYGGDIVKHTRKMVKMIESLGIKTLGYFVDDYLIVVHHQRNNSNKCMVKDFFK